MGFDRPIDEFSIGDDVKFLFTATDGTQAVIPNAGEWLDTDPSWLVVALPEGCKPGRYQVILGGGSGLSGTDFSTLGGDGSDQVLGEFSVGGSATSMLDHATDLGTLGGGVRAVAGQLDLSLDSSAVALYKFQVPTDGSLHLLGAETWAGRIGSPLKSYLTLFDAKGKILASAMYGRADAPSDPFLFAGLGGGTYYLGVSGQNNQPGTDGGYDPSTDQPGQAQPGEPGGPFTLYLSNDPAGPTTEVRSFVLTHADPGDPRPSGFDLGFSGSLNFTVKGGATLAAVDAGGTLWPVTVTSYDEASATLSGIFDRTLPAGQYTLQVVDPASLLDLAGRTPVATDSPAGILASFSVNGDSPVLPPDHLGLLSPEQLKAGIDIPINLQAGETADYSFALPENAVYQVTPSADAGQLVCWLSGDSDGMVRGHASSQMGQERSVELVQLEPGVYRLRVVAGSISATGHVRLALISTHFERVLLNGVGQGPALNLRLVTPSFDTSIGSGTTPSDPGSPQVPTPTDSSSQGPPSGAFTPSSSGSSPTDESHGSSTSGAQPSNPPVPATATKAPAKVASPTGLYLAVGGQPAGHSAFLEGLTATETPGGNISMPAEAISSGPTPGPGQSTSGGLDLFSTGGAVENSPSDQIDGEGADGTILSSEELPPLDNLVTPEDQPAPLELIVAGIDQLVGPRVLSADDGGLPAEQPSPEVAKLSSPQEEESASRPLGLARTAGLVVLATATVVVVRRRISARRNRQAQGEGRKPMAPVPHGPRGLRPRIHLY